MTDTIQKTVDPILKTVDSTVTSQLTDPGALAELGLSVVALVLVISVHGWCLGHISRQFAGRFGKFDARTNVWKINFLMGITVALLAATHLVETLIWAYPIWHLGLIDTFRASYSYTLEAYTTLGEGGVSLPDDWRLLGPVIAISGLFTFSWTGSVLVYVMSEIGKLHARSTHRAAKPPEK